MHTVPCNVCGETHEFDEANAAQSLWGAGGDQGNPELTTTARPLNLPGWAYVVAAAVILLSLGGWGWLKWRRGRVTR